MSRVVANATLIMRRHRQTAVGDCQCIPRNGSLIRALSLELFRAGVGCPPVPECLIGQQVDPGPVRGDILPKSLGRFACVLVTVWLTVFGGEVVHAFITRDLKFSGQTGAVIVAARSCSFGGHDVWCAAGAKRTKIADTSRQRRVIGIHGDTSSRTESGVPAIMIRHFSEQLVGPFVPTSKLLEMARRSGSMPKGL